MNAMRSPRHPALWVVAPACLLAACWTTDTPSEPVPRARTLVSAAPAARVVMAPPQASARAGAAAPPAAAVPAVEPAGVDPFAATSWVPAPAVPAAATPAAPAPAAAPPGPPPAPTAPPNPFVYVGSYKDGSHQVVMLLRGDQLLLVQQGETIDNAYRLDRIAPGNLVMTYLPLQVRQSVPITDPA